MIFDLIKTDVLEMISLTRVYQKLRFNVKAPDSEVYISFSTSSGSMVYHRHQSEINVYVQMTNQIVP